MFRFLCFAALLPLAVAARSGADVGGYPEAEALQHGERMYREGLLPSGEPMQAIVQGDIPVDGTMFSCASCHLRSGVGSIEGTVITLPTNSAWLYEPLVGARMSPTSRERLPAHLRREAFRPPYTDETLAHALRAGVDPSGRRFNPVMPRYLLDAGAMEVMVFYLKNLSREPSPGVTDTVLRFATVVGEGVSPEDRRAMLDCLEAHVKDTNSQSRHQERRAAGGPFYKEEKLTAYRRLELLTWELTGPPESWGGQLEAYYREQPVFALLGGITAGEWAPIHEFCETMKIPCLFPLTDFPVISDSDWYTLYLSKGWAQDGEAAARYLRQRKAEVGDRPVIQVYRDEASARMLAASFSETRVKIRQPPPEDRVLSADQVVTAEFWRRLAEERPDSVLVLWLGSADLAAIGALAEGSNRPRLALVSTGLMGDRLHVLPEEVRGFTYLVHRYSLPGEKPRAVLAVDQWLRSHKIAPGDRYIQSNMYFLGWTLAGMIKMMRHDFYRDYFFDVVDMMRDQYYTVVSFPRLSFGPGQRYASKGCYVAQLTEGPEPKLVAKTGWVVH